MFREYDFKRFDFFIIIYVITLLVIGIIAIGSATGINTEYGFGNEYKKQILGAIFGFLLVLIISLIDYKFIAKFYWVFYIFNIALLGAVIVFGDEVNGAKRWISIVGIRLQPSELCKFFLILFLAKHLDKNQKKINNPAFLLVTAILLAIPIFLVNIEDLSTSFVITMILIVIIFASGISYKYVIAALAIAIPIVSIGMWYVQQPDQQLLQQYQVDRILAFTQPDMVDRYKRIQTENSIQAIGSGQLYGKGLYQGKLHQYNYLPEPQTDFIFSIIGEEFGFIGCSIIIILVLFLLINCLWIAKDSKDLMGRLIIVGFVAMISIQTYVNIGVTTGLMPNTGIPLPFVSYGLSSLMTNLICLGFVLNISIQRKSIYS